MRMKIGQILSYPQPRRPDDPLVDGLSNFFFETACPGLPMAGLERGINPIKAVATDNGPIVPAILIRSSPHRTGSVATPWQDFHDPDNGHIRYFGDHKYGAAGSPESSSGNKALLRQRALHQSPDLAERRRAAPLLFYLAVPQDGRVKGNVRFQGLGVLDRVELVTQWDRHASRAFANYRYDLVILSLAPEAEMLDWEWINARRLGQPLGATEKLAPKAWRAWMAGGPSALPRLRRSVARMATVEPAAQRPAIGSKEAQILDDVYSYYAKKKAAFEGLAEVITESVLRDSGSEYMRGWITPKSGDHGADFVGRLDVGTGFAKTRLVVLGQAKCEKPTSPTGGRDIARTAARLRRGWLGAYVTTSFFSRPVQEEVIEDEYPLILINGLQIAESLLQIMFERGLTKVEPILEEIESEYPARISYRRPSEILWTELGQAARSIGVPSTGSDFPGSLNFFFRRRRTCVGTTSRSAPNLSAAAYVARRSSSRSPNCTTRVGFTDLMPSARTISAATARPSSGGSEFPIWRNPCHFV